MKSDPIINVIMQKSTFSTTGLEDLLTAQQVLKVCVTTKKKSWEKKRSDPWLEGEEANI